MPLVAKPLFLTPEELARALRVDPETVRRWEEGVRLLGGEERLEEALKEVRG